MECPGSCPQSILILLFVEWPIIILFTKYSLAKREMLLVASESLVGAQQKQLQLTAYDFQRINARNDQLVKV